MSPDQFWYQFWYVLSKVLPWFVAGGGTVGVLLLTPFGKALTKYLRSPRPPSAVSPELLDELGQLRRDLGEVLGRLDTLEGYLSRGQTDADRPRLP